MKYRKKPVVIEAIQNTGEWAPIVAWLEAIAGDRFGGFAFPPGTVPPVTRNADGSLNVTTLEGVMRANVGDWLLQGVAGELYPCKPDIFAATYESADLETVIYVYRSAVERRLYLPDLTDPLILGPGASVEVRWLR